MEATTRRKWQYGIANALIKLDSGYADQIFTLNVDGMGLGFKCHRHVSSILHLLSIDRALWRLMERDSVSEKIIRLILSECVYGEFLQNKNWCPSRLRPFTYNIQLGIDWIMDISFQH